MYSKIIRIKHGKMTLNIWPTFNYFMATKVSVTEANHVKTQVKK